MENNEKRDSKVKGPYIIGKTLGEGTFGKVKLSTHVHTKEKVAIKILDKDRMFKSEIDLNNVKQEIEIMKLVKHKNVVQMYEIMESENKLYIVLDFCEKGELFDYIVERERLNEKKACSFFQQLIDGIEYIHQINICHRDLKPENILLDSQENIKISDFGLSKIYQGRLQTPCGTTSYAPPEMLKGLEYEGSAADVWSAGIILYAMLCGCLPFTGKNDEEVGSKIINGVFDLPPYLSLAAKDLLSKIIVTNPAKRIKINQIRQHKFFRQKEHFKVPGIIDSNDPLIDEMVLLKAEEYGFNGEKIRRHMKEGKFDTHTAVYYFCLKQMTKKGFDSFSDVNSAAFLKHMIEKRTKEVKIKLDEVTKKRHSSVAKDCGRDSVFVIGEPEVKKEVKREKSVLEMFIEKSKNNRIVKSAIKVRVQPVIEQNEMVVKLFSKRDKYNGVIAEFNREYKSLVLGKELSAINKSNFIEFGTKLEKSVEKKVLRNIKKIGSNVMEVSGDLDFDDVLEKMKVAKLKIGNQKYKISSKNVNAFVSFKVEDSKTIVELSKIKGSDKDFLAFEKRFFKICSN